MKDFAGKVAVITGAGRGIGRGIALRCAKEGMKVVLAGIGMESLTKTEADLKALGAETLAVQTDVAKLADVENLAQQAIDAFGEVHLLVNNAGVNVFKTLLDSTIADLEWVMGVNFWGVVYGIKTFLPIMKEQGNDCHIVNVSSINGITSGFGRLASYSASKQAVVGLSEALYREVAAEAPNVKVTVYCPGQVNTNLMDAQRNRPEGEQAKPNEQEQAMLQFVSKQLAQAMSPEAAADVLFKGMVEEKLYVGVVGFSEQHPDLVKYIQARTDNIINENNPFIPPSQ